MKDLYFLYAYKGPLHTNNLNGSFFYILDYFLYFLIRNMGVNPHLFLLTDNPNKFDKNVILEIVNDRYELNLDGLSDKISAYPNPRFAHSGIGYAKSFKEFLDLNSFLKGKDVFTNVEVLNDLPFDKKFKFHKLYCQHTRESVTKLKKDDFSRILEFSEEKHLYNEKHKHILLNELRHPSGDVMSRYAVNLRQPRGSMVTYDLFKHHMEEISSLYGDKPIIAFGDQLNVDPGVCSMIEEFFSFHPSNFFGLFDTYVDVLFDTYDYSPRMILECRALGKSVASIRTTRSIYRLHDGNDLRMKNLDNWRDYQISEKDKIIQDIIT